MVLAAGGVPPLGWCWPRCVGGTLAAGGANALNCYLDRDIDALMRPHRAAARWSPARVSPRAALVFGIVLGRARRRPGWDWPSTGCRPGSRSRAILFYVLVYTLLLKRRTSQNIVWGGAAGCMPVLIGWSAVTGSLAWAPVVLFVVMFFWTPPHYWPLAMRSRTTTPRAGVPMLPVVASRSVARQIVAYTWVMVAASLLLWPLATGWVYGVLAARRAARGCWPRRTGFTRPRRTWSAGAADAAVPPVDHATWRFCSWPSRWTPSCAEPAGSSVKRHEGSASALIDLVRAPSRTGKSGPSNRGIPGPDEWGRGRCHSQNGWSAPASHRLGKATGRR